MALKRMMWIAAALVTASPMALAAGKDGLWELTTKMEMEGMPQMPKGMSIPGMPGSASKQTVCLAEGQKHESKEQSECKVLEQRQSGRKSFTKIKCKDGTMTIEHEVISKDQWRSKMVMSGEHAATINTDGKRIGSCDASKEGGMSRETQKVVGDMSAQTGKNAAEMGKECQKSLGDWPGSNTHNVFQSYDSMAKQRANAIRESKGQNMKMIDASSPEIPHCAKAKADYCNKSKAAGSEIASRKGYMTFFGKHRKVGPEPALKYCGVDSAAVLAGHCKAGLAESDYAFVSGRCPAERPKLCGKAAAAGELAFVGRHCPAETKALAKKHCEGYKYTSQIPAKYQTFCARAAAGEEGEGDDGSAGGDKDGGGKAGGGKDGGGTAGAAKEESAVEGGVKMLKGLFSR